MVERYLLYYISIKVYKESVKHKKELPIFSKKPIQKLDFLLFKRSSLLISRLAPEEILSHSIFPVEYSNHHWGEQK